MDLAPVALFAYNRPDHLHRTAEALARNDLASQTDVLVYVDGPRSSEDVLAVEEVRNVARAIEGFRSVRTVVRSENLGLATSIISGVSEVCSAHGSVIVVEDDLVTSPYFLRFLNDGLAMYESDPEVVGISGFMYPHRADLHETFFLRGAYNLGWATWSRGWSCFNPDGVELLRELKERRLTREFDVSYYPYTAMLEAQVSGTVDSWAIRWYASAFLANKLTLFHRESLVQNIGFDGSGTNVGTRNMLDVPLAIDPVRVSRIPLSEDPRARKAFKAFLRKEWAMGPVWKVRGLMDGVQRG